MPAGKLPSVLFVTHYLDLYGANRSLLNLIEGLKENGLQDISVIIPHTGQLCNKLTELSIPYHIIPFVLEVQTTSQFYLKRVAKKFYNLFLVKKHRHLFKEKENLVIHTNSSITFFGAYLANALRVPHVWHIREFGKADYNLEYNFGNAYFLKWADKAAAIICISKALYNERFKQDIKATIKIIYNGIVSLKNLNTGFAVSAKDKTFRFGISGNITKEKNQEEAIEAFNVVAKNYNCELWIAGTGKADILQQLQQKINGYGLQDRIKFKGFVDDIFTFYNSLDCVLMCSKNEALGRVTVEAMSKGLPVIGFNNAGTAEIIRDDYNGLLYNNGCAELAEKMKAVIDNYEAFFQLRKNAVKTVEENFTVEKNTKAVMEVYNSVLAK